MDRDLTPAQRYELIDFLKRWGIDHPELLAEMTDHYTEKALESMATGNTFDGALDSWKTKETFRTLRKIQHDHENVFPAKVRRQQWAVVKSTFFNTRGSILMLLLFVVLMGVASLPMGLIILHKALIIYACFSLGAMLYVSLNKRKRKILSFRNFAFYYGYNTFLWQVAFGEYLDSTAWEWSIQPATVLDISALWIGIVLSVVTYKLWQHTKTETAHLTDQMLKEHIPARYE
jgi:hypothetical protein